MKSLVFSMLLPFFGLAAAGQSQEVRILVLEAHHGRPVPHECLNISLGAWHGTDILAATDQRGVATVLIDHDQVSAKSVQGFTCQSIPSTKSISGTEPPLAISVLPNWYVSCQYSKEIVRDPVWLKMTPAQRIPSFALQTIFSAGAVTTNHCSKLAPSSEPGELVFIVRKRTFLEGMRS